MFEYAFLNYICIWYISVRYRFDDFGVKQYLELYVYSNGNAYRYISTYIARVIPFTIEIIFFWFLDFLSGVLTYLYTWLNVHWFDLELETKRRSLKFGFFLRTHMDHLCKATRNIGKVFEKLWITENSLNMMFLQMFKNV